MYYSLCITIIAGVFVDLERAFDRVPREAIRCALRCQKVPEHLIAFVMALNSNTKVKGQDSSRYFR